MGIIALCFNDTLNSIIHVVYKFFTWAISMEYRSGYISSQNSFKFDGRVFASLDLIMFQRCTIGFVSRLWGAQGRMFSSFSSSQDSDSLDVWHGAPSCWKINSLLPASALPDGTRVLFKILMYPSLLRFPSTQWRIPTPLPDIQPHTISDPPPCFHSFTDTWLFIFLPFPPPYNCSSWILE